MIQANVFLLLPSYSTVLVSLFQIGLYDPSNISVIFVNQSGQLVVPWRSPSPLAFKVFGFPFSWTAAKGASEMIPGQATETLQVPLTAEVTNVSFSVSTAVLLVSLSTFQIAPNGVDVLSVSPLAVMPSAAISLVSPTFVDWSAPVTFQVSSTNVYSGDCACVVAQEFPAFAILYTVPAVPASPPEPLREHSFLAHCQSRRLGLLCVLLARTCIWAINKSEISTLCPPKTLSGSTLSRLQNVASLPIRLKRFFPVEAGNMGRSQQHNHGTAETNLQYAHLVARSAGIEFLRTADFDAEDVAAALADATPQHVVQGQPLLASSIFKALGIYRQRLLPTSQDPMTAIETFFRRATIMAAGFINIPLPQ